MTQVPELLNALSSLLWPLLVIVVVVRLSPVLREILESARSRKFILKIGGQELSMEEASQQQQNLIADLQNQVNQLQQAVETVLRSQPVTSAPLQPDKLSHTNLRAHRILWVDDNPKNNSYFLQLLSDAGVAVDLALSTAEGMRKLQSKRYRAIISDMGREEHGEYRPFAGMDLLRKIRAVDKDTPFVIYCARKKAEETKEEAQELGATAVLSSPTAMMGMLKKLLPELQATADN